MKDKDKTNDEVKEQKENEPQEAKEPASVEPETSVSSDAEAEEKAILEDVEELQKKFRGIHGEIRRISGPPAQNDGRIR